MRTLYGLTQSPWTEKARWALDHHNVPYRYHEHVPLLGEPFLRIKARTREPGTKASVPLLVDGSAVFTSSLSIARHADGIGRGEALFRRGSEEEVARWAAVSDEIIGVGRTRVVTALRTDRAAQREAVPSFVPDALRGAVAPVTAAAAWFLRSKYDVALVAQGDSTPTESTRLRTFLDEVRRGLDGKPYLTGSFSFADIAVAASLQALRPRSRAPLGPATRAIWADESLQTEFADLLTWRDALYTKHRLRV